MLVPVVPGRDSTRIYLVVESVGAGRDTRYGQRQENAIRWGGEDPVERDRLSPSILSLTSPTVLTQTQTPGSSTSFPLQMISGTWTKSPRRPVFSMLKVRIPNQKKHKNKVKYFLIGKCRRKINIKRAGAEVSQSTEFKSWLESFLVRSPEKFICADRDE